MEDDLGLILKFVFFVVPCLYSLCRPHAIRAAYHWVDDKSRVTVVRNNRRFFKDLVVNWLRHTTCTITLAEAIVNAAIVIYAMEMEVIDVDKAGVTLTPFTNKDVSVRLQESISKGVKDFVLEYTKTIQNELADEYADFSSAFTILSVNKKYYRTVQIVRRVVDSAKSRRLRVSYTYLVSANADQVFLETSVVCGLYPPLPRRTQKPTERDFNGTRTAVFTSKSVTSIISKEALNRISTPTFSMPNPMYAPSVCEYMYDE
jgi:hypothetical protein